MGSSGSATCMYAITRGLGGIAYAVHVDLWGQGYGEAIARAVVQIAFEEVGLHRVVATCDPRNVASARVLQKIGMTFDRRLHRASCFAMAGGTPTYMR